MIVLKIYLTILSGTRRLSVSSMFDYHSQLVGTDTDSEGELDGRTNGLHERSQDPTETQIQFLEKWSR